MRIDIEKLVDSGWDVEFTMDNRTSMTWEEAKSLGITGIVVYGKEPVFRDFPILVSQIERETGLDGRAVEEEVERFASRLQRRMIFDLID